MEAEGSLPCSREPTTGPHLVQSTPSQNISIKFVLILLYHLFLGPSSDLFPSGYPIKILYAFLISSIRATCLARLSLLHLITRIIFDEAFVCDNIKTMCSLKLEKTCRMII